MAVFGLLALAASVYLVYVLEILKLRQVRLRQLIGSRGARPGAPARPPQEVDEAVARELETGSFPSIDPETGEFEAVDRRAAAGVVATLTKWLQQSHSRGLSDIVASPPARPEPGVFRLMSPPKYVDLLAAGRRSRSLSAGRASRCSATPSAPPPGCVQRGVQMVATKRAKAELERRQPPEGDGDRRRDDARPRLADGHRGPRSSASPNARPGSPPRSSSSSSSRSPSPPRASPTSSASPRGRGRVSAEQAAPRRRPAPRVGAGEVRRAQHQSQGLHRARRLPRDRDPDVADLRQRRQKRSTSSPRTSSSSNRGSRSTSAAIDLEHQQGGRSTSSSPAP